MKKLMTVMLALSFSIGTVAVCFAQDAPPKKEDTKKKKNSKKKKKKGEGEKKGGL